MKIFSLLFAALLCLFSNAFAGNPEFEGNCTMHMALGKKQPTDCSIIWLAKDDKIYCFADQAAKQKFLESPKENLQRAQAFWEDPETLKRLLRRE